MVSNSQITRAIREVPTEIVIQVFVDRILVLITQLGKVGNLIQATIPATSPLIPPTPSADPSQLSLPPPPPSIELTPLLSGAPSEHMQTLHSLYASQVATLVWVAEAEGILEADRRGVIVGIALRKAPEQGQDGSLSDHEKDTFYGVMRMVQELLLKN